MRNLIGILLALGLAACSPANNEPEVLACGMTEIIWEVDRSALTQNYLENVEDDVRSLFLPNDIRYQDLNAEDGRLRVHVWQQDDQVQASELLETLVSVFDADGNKTLRIVWDNDGWTEIIVTEAYLNLMISRATESSVTYMRRRLGTLGYEPVTVEQLNDKQLLTVTPSGPPPNRGFEHHWREPLLEFRMMDTSVPVEQALEGQSPPGSEILPTIDDTEPYLLVRRRALIDGDRILAVTLTHTLVRRNPVLQVQMDFRAGQALERIAESQAGETMAIVLDDVIIQRFTIPDRIANGQFQLRGFSDDEEAEELVSLLNSGGSLAPLTVVQETVGPACQEGE